MPKARTWSMAFNLPNPFRHGQAEGLYMINESSYDRCIRCGRNRAVALVGWARGSIPPLLRR